MPPSDTGCVFPFVGPSRSSGNSDAYQLLSPLLGVSLQALFAIALLASGQNSTLTGTPPARCNGRFLNIRITPWLRRLITEPSPSSRGLGHRHFRR
jgi:manganese transport protein